SWLSDLVDAATDRDVLVTLENVDEPPEVLRKALDAVPDLRHCLDVGHAHLDQRTDGARHYLAVLGDRLALTHVHDNHGGPEEGLRPAERTTWSELITSIRTDLDWALSDVEEWTVDPLNGPAVTLLNVESYQAVRTAVDGRRMVTRWGAMASYLEDHVANLRRGLQGGRVAVRSGVLKVIEQIDD